MLILTRKPGEKLVFWDSNGMKIHVAVLETKGSQVRIGIDAPDHINVDREEIFQRKQANPHNLQEAS